VFTSHIVEMIERICVN